MSEEYFATLKFPVKIAGIAENKSLSSQSVDEVQLNLKGQGWQLAQLTFGLSPDFIINSKNNLGEQTVPLRNEIESNSWLSSSIQVLSINPEKIIFNIENITQKKVKIEPDIDLEFKPNYGLVSDIIVSPDSVIIRGPESLITKIGKVFTEKKEFKDSDRNVLESISLEKINFVEMSQEQTAIKFDVQKIVDKTFENILVEILGVPASRQLVLYPAKVDIVLRGGINLLGKLNSSDIRAYVYFSQAISDTSGGIVPYFEIPAFTAIIDKIPNKLEYIIKQF
ncbi:MAG: hypothetical protein F9K45_01445 [Melioribacteraceae bacterium]|nr:MAG: hypothetical protein F9K45_01445 [Melioribacteraceae bacterium]